MSIAAAGSENCLAIGTRLSDFEVTGVLGEGGFGIVYLAFDHALQRTVAIKEYMPGVLAARGSDHSVAVRAERHQETFDIGLKSFINEARFLAQFDHPSLVKVYRYWEQNQTAYTAMQYYEGRTVKDIVSASPELVTEQWCLSIVRQILDALEMLYTMNIVHRDVSPDNIIVQDNGDAVLLDFGSARQIIGDRTRGLTVILKPGYAPVEQYAGDASLDQGPYTDIYALSAVMYYAIVGEPPATSIARMVKDPITPLRERAPAGFSQGFLAAIDHGLAVLAAERPQSIDAFRALLGIAPAAPPRARAGASSQRFATVERLPGNAPAATVLTQPHPSSTAGLVAPPVLLPVPALRRPHWMVPAGAALVLLALIVAASYSLLGEPDGVFKPVEQSRLAPAQPAAAPAAITTVAAVAPAAKAPEPPPEPVPEIVPAPVELPAKALAAPAATVTYQLAIQPWGTVYVDGKQRGVSPPLKKLNLSAGKHTIKVVNPSFPDHVTSVTASPGKPGTIGHDFSASSN